MIVIGYYTDSYRDYARTLWDDLKALGLPHDLTRMNDCGTYEANVRMKPHVILSMLHHHKSPVLYVDVDARIRTKPRLLAPKIPEGADVAAHYWHVEGGVEPPQLLGGTLWFAYNTYAVRTLKAWMRRNEERPEETDQANLQAVLEECPAVRVLRLPPTYCWLETAMRPFHPDAQPVVDHMGVSRRRWCR